MQITTDNYELYTIDYLEGGLSGEELRCMEAFLDQHPDIKAALTGLESITLTADPTIQYPNKEKLLKKEQDLAFPWLWTAVSIIFIAILIPFMIWQQQEKTMTEPKAEQIADKKSEITSEITSETKVQTDVQTEIIQNEAAVIENSTADISKNKTAAIDSDKNTNAATAVQAGRNKENKVVSPVIIETPELKRRAESDSLKQLLDSLQLKNGKAKIEFSAMPLANLELKVLEINKKEVVLSPKMLLELAALQNSGNDMAKVKKPKSFKTPFGTIRFNDIRDALLPESYIASVK
jgi:hypothetical protein